MNRARRPGYAPRVESLEGRLLLTASDSGRILVGFSETSNEWAFDLALRRLNAQVVEEYSNGPSVVQLAPGWNLESAAQRLARIPGVRYAEVDGLLIRDAAIANDPMIDSLWGLNQPSDIDIDAPQAWTVTTGRPETVVAVIDSGIDLSHPDLVGRIWVNPGEIPNNGQDDDRNGYADDYNGWNFYARNNDVRDLDGHGTHVAGTIAATANNRTGIAGVAPGVRVMPLKFFGPSNDGAISDAVAAIYYAVDKGAKVINASWGGAGYSRSLEDAIAYANSQGVVFVTAAGNASSNNDLRPTYPPSLALPNVVSVAAIDRDGNLASFSNYGVRTVDVAAPGVSILSTVPGGRYETYTGTSMATPHVSGVVALLASRSPELSAAELVERVRASAKPLPGLNGKVISGGIVDADGALTFGGTSDGSQPAQASQPTALDLRAVVLASEEFYIVNGSSPAGFVEGLYRSLLGRPSDPNGKAIWVGALHLGWSREQVARAILGAEETYRTTVARWFISDLGRPASTLESLKNEAIVREWASSLARGTSPDEVRAGILASDEYYAVRGQSSEAYVNALYRSVLGRPAEPAGLRLWTNALRLGWTRRQVAEMVLVTPEARQTTIARWFVDDLRRPVPLATLKSDPTILSWAQNAVF